MKYIFVFTISLYVGFASGFIAPAGVPKIMDDTGKDDIKENTDKYVVTRNNFSAFDLNKTLYEHDTERENAVNIRSIIFFNKEYAAPMRETYNIKYYKISPRNKNYSTQTSLIDLDKARYKEFPHRFAAGSVNEGYLKDKSSGYHIRNKLSNEFLVNSLFDKDLKKIQKKYFRLLLNPLLIKSKSNKYRRIPYAYLSNNDLSKTIINKHSKYCDKIQNSHHILLRNNIAQKSVNEFSDTARLHLLQKSTDENKQLIFNSEKLSFIGELATGVINKRLGANENKEKDLPQNQINSKKLVNHEKCTNYDCINARKQHNKHDCDGHNKRERLNREDLKFNEAVVFPDSPINYNYDEIKNEMSQNRTINDELLNMINKLNNTLEMYK